MLIKDTGKLIMAFKYIPHCGLLLLLMIMVFLAAGCTKSVNPDIERGSSFNYRSGYPEVRISAIGLLDELDNPGINVSADIVYGSLIYKKKGGNQVAGFDIEIRILEQGENASTVKTRNFSRVIERANSNIVYSQELYTFEKRIPVEPGSYKIMVTIIDKNSGKTTVRTAQTYLPNPENNVSNLTNVQMMGKNMDEQDPKWFSMTTYDIRGRIDSLRFIVQVTNNRSEEPLSIDAQLLRFESDTTIAKPMFYNNYNLSSIAYRGIDYDDSDIIESTRRLLTQPGSVVIEYNFAQQPRGNYRFEVRTSRGDESENSELFKARDFSVKSQNYPTVQNARELARPLAYLMKDDEYEELMATSSNDSLKKKIDRFWLKNVQNKNKAKNVIQLYYERVEEANKRFSNFKEGWKTDPGMIYILFGSPWNVEQHLDMMTWSFTHNRNNPEYNFTFLRPKNKSEFYPFDNFLLQRRQIYYSVQFQQVDLWLSGEILTRRI